jgi:quinol-cytochrome oxidoreductase complex cytochrome b subunit/ferredoxin
MRDETYRRKLPQFFLRFFSHTETVINHVLGERWNFFYFLGSLPIILLFVLLATGLFMFIYYNMSVSSSYESVKYMTENAALGKFMRNLHRYAADAMMFFVILHLLRVLLEEKFQNHRTLAWITGLILMGLMLVQGITGYILPLDDTSRYVMEKTSEILAGLRVFGDTLPRSFSSPALLGKWIMWVVLIVHLIIPLFFILLIFVHLLRVSRAKLFPPKHITLAFLGLLALYTLVWPISMAEKASAEKMPQLLQPDWFYLFFAPVFEHRLSLYIWLGMGLVLIALFALPWLVHRRKIIPAVVSPEKCTGCAICATDCPYQAMHMVETKTLLQNGDLAATTHKHKFLVSIDTDLCSGCGICAGSCTYGALSFPGATPREASGVDGKWLILLCQNRAQTLSLGAAYSNESIPGAKFQIAPCAGALGVSEAEGYRLAGAKGIIVGACPTGDCWYREGNTWLRDRINQKRRPGFRKIPESFPIIGLQFTGIQGADFSRAAKAIVNDNTFSGKPLPLRLFEFLKPSQWAYSFSISTIMLTVLLWTFFVGSSARFGAVTRPSDVAMLRLDFFYQTDKKTCSPDMIPPGAREAALERMAGLVKLDNLTPEARERILQQAADSVASKYCSRHRRKLEIRILIDGRLSEQRTFSPSGFQNDGITYVLLKHRLPPGPHLVSISAHEHDTQSLGRRLEYTQQFDLTPGEIKLIDYEPNEAKLYVRKGEKTRIDATGKE